MCVHVLPIGQSVCVYLCPCFGKAVDSHPLCGTKFIVVRVVTYACNFSPREEDEVGSDIQGHTQLHGKLKASLG